MAVVAVLGTLTSAERVGHAEQAPPDDGAAAPPADLQVPEPAIAPSEASAAAPKPEPKKAKEKKKSRVKVSGYLQIYFRDRFDTVDDGRVDPAYFRVLRARLKVSGKILPRVSYRLEIDPRAPFITGVMRDAYLQLKLIPHHKIRIGQQKTQFGYEQSASSTELYTVNRSEMADNLASGRNGRDIGVGLLGGWPLGHGVSLEDAITVVNGAGMNVQIDDTPRKNVWGRIGVRYDDPAGRIWARLGVSGGIGDQTEPPDPGPPPIDGYTFTIKRLGADLELDHPLGFATAEYVWGRDKAPASADASGDVSGYNLLLAVKTPWKAGPLVRYNALEEFKSLTLGAFWGLPTDPLRVLVNYEIYQDEVGKHDHALYLWTQARF